MSKLACSNSKQTFSKMMFKLYGVRCFDKYDEFEYLENILHMDLIKSGYTCPQISKC